MTERTDGRPPGFEHKMLDPGGLMFRGGQRIQFGQPVAGLKVASGAGPKRSPGRTGPPPADGGRGALLAAKATAERVELALQRVELERRLAEPCDYWLLPDLGVDRAVRQAAGAALASSRDQLGLSRNLHLVWFAPPDELGRHERPLDRPWGSFGGALGLTGAVLAERPAAILVRRTADPEAAARTVAHEACHWWQLARAGPAPDAVTRDDREAEAQAFAARWMRYEWPLVDPGAGRTGEARG